MPRHSQPKAAGPRAQRKRRGADADADGEADVEADVEATGVGVDSPMVRRAGSSIVRGASIVSPRNDRPCMT